MKTQLPVQSNFSPTEKEMEIRLAIHILQDACDDEIVLMQDEDVRVYLIPSILGDGEDPDLDDDEQAEPRPAGTVEYQLSDGLAGHRSTCFSYYNLEEAIQEFHKLVKLGWKKFSTGGSNAK